MEIFGNPALWKTVGLLVVSNCFMTFAWYGHLRTLGGKPLVAAILISWGIAFFEYCAQVPANRIGHAGNIGLAQLKILQEIIKLAVFVPFSVYFMREPLRWNFLWAGLCMVGAVYFIFKK
ncbi:MAG: DMT family protein [Victivallaceae bacterium]|nr:DMT family protein [Victivallaceae bacterium]